MDRIHPLLLHGLMFTLVVFSPSLFPMSGDANWGSATEGDGGINVKIVGTVSGVSASLSRGRY